MADALIFAACLFVVAAVVAYLDYRRICKRWEGR